MPRTKKQKEWNERRKAAERLLAARGANRIANEREPELVELSGYQRCGGGRRIIRKGVE